MHRIVKLNQKSLIQNIKGLFIDINVPSIGSCSGCSEKTQVR